MATLKVQLIAKQHAERRRAWADYRTIAKRSNAAGDGDVERMIEVCELLGIEIGDVESDHAAFQQMPALIDQAKRRDGVQKKLQAMGVKERKVKAELVEMVKGKNAALREIRREQQRLVDECNRASAAYARIEQLQAKHWRIFDTPSPMPESIGVGKFL